MTLPLALIPWIEQRFLLADGSPNAGGSIETYASNLTTPQATYTGPDIAIDPANPTTITLDADGRPPDPIFLAPTGYGFKVYDADGVQLYSITGVEDPGAVAFATLANTLAEGSRDQVSGYVIDNDDNTVTVLPAASPDPCLIFLPAAADRTFPLTIISKATAVVVRITRDGTDTLNGQSANLDLDPGVSPAYSGVTLLSDGVSDWLVSAYWVSA